MPGLETAGFDWPALMRAGMRGLGLTPQDFWALTPAELQLMLGDGAGNRPLGRQRLDELMAAFPDMSGRPGGSAMPGGSGGFAMPGGPNRSDET